MRDLSMHVLDIAQNSIKAGASLVTVAFAVDENRVLTFSVRDDGTVTYTGTAYRALQGIDVSTFQQEIDWQTVADSGIDFAFIHAQSGAGHSHAQAERGDGGRDFWH